MYRIGPLFPKDQKGEPNIILSSSFEMLKGADGSYSVSPSSDQDKQGKLKTTLKITTDPIRVPGIDVFMKDWLIPQMTVWQNENNYYAQPSMYTHERSAASKYLTKPKGTRFIVLYEAVRAGYVGPGSKDYATNNSFWNSKANDETKSSKWAKRDQEISEGLNNDNNWKAKEYWGAYKGGTTIKSKYDEESLKTALPDYKGSAKEQQWTPSLLYTYKKPGHRATMPGPVLMVNPGDQVNINFKNEIAIPGFSLDQLNAVSGVENQSQGSGGSSGMGGTTSTNFHGHGLHVNSVGFGDNVVSRYTTGQSWTTDFDIEKYHNKGSYWYHPHYHPSVNQQMYGGLSGAMQVGDPLGRVPDFKDVPRNMAVIKQNAFSVDRETGKLQLDNYVQQAWANQLAASTVNGEFNPTVNSDGGWQALSVSNQANQALYNISLHHTDPDGKRSVLPVFIYGEDGHQYPEIRRAKGVLAQLVDKKRRNKMVDDYEIYNACGTDEGPGIPLPIKYPHKKKKQNIQLQDFVSLPPGKRADLLFYLPEGKTEITSLYTIHTDSKKFNLYSVNNMGLYPNLTSSNREWRLGNNGCKISFDSDSQSSGGAGSGSGQGQESGAGTGSGGGQGQGAGSGSGQGQGSGAGTGSGGGQGQGSGSGSGQGQGSGAGMGSGGGQSARRSAAQSREAENESGAGGGQGQGGGAGSGQSQGEGAGSGTGQGQESGAGTGSGGGQGQGGGTGSGGGQMPSSDFPHKHAGHGQGQGGLKNELRRPGPGQLATFIVSDGAKLPEEKDLEAAINAANKNISVEEINPTTDVEQYDVDKEVPAINLFKKKWEPLRRREFNWANRVLVGPKDEWDAYTQEQAKNPPEGYSIEPFTQGLMSYPGGWMGYDSPFLINDHVFPNGPLTIAQLGTLEEWTLWNWSVLNGQKYTGHPFHIHVNDYQVHNSDTELSDKRNLEDTTMLNSTGWNFKDMSAIAEGQPHLQSEPFRGDFKEISIAIDPPKDEKLITWGANSMKIRMMFQDYVGTYVYHCHILPHEDRGMMQVVTVVENTDSSWLLPVEGLENEAFIDGSGAMNVYKAQDYDRRSVDLDALGVDRIQRTSVGDINNDDVQDIALSIGSEDIAAGYVVVVDGADLLNENKTTIVTSFAPRDDRLAPWVFVEDFSGDGRRDLVTAGFLNPQEEVVDLLDLRVDMFLPKDRDKKRSEWNKEFTLNPFKDISLTGSTCKSASDCHQHSLQPVQGLTSSQVSVTMADMNLDNFNDYILAYAIDDGLRIIALDGAAVALHYQTGKKEGGYFADKAILAQSVLVDSEIAEIDRVVLTSGFNDYYQAPIENLLVNVQSGSKFSQYSLQLNAGHFVATAENEKTSGHGSHGHGHSAQPVDDRIVNYDANLIPMKISDNRILPKNNISPTPVIAGARGNGAQILDSHIAFAQGNNVNGNKSSSPRIHNTTQQALVPLVGLGEVNEADLEGIVDVKLKDTFDLNQVDSKNNVAAMAHIAYAGGFAHPGEFADLASGILGKGNSISDLADELAGGDQYKQSTEDNYGGNLDDVSVESIVNKATKLLAGRKASKDEIIQWSERVDGGFSKTDLPMSVLLNFSGNDLNRIALLSASSQWFLSQWATNANVQGSFSQGFASNDKEFSNFESTIMSLGRFQSLSDAQDAFDSFQKQSLNEITGTPLSKRGMF